MDDVILRLGDCLEVLPTLPRESVDLVITSPPYNVGLDYGNGKDKDFVPVSSYHSFAVAVMKELARVVKVGGRICFEIGGSGNNNRSSWTWQDSAYKAGLDLFSEIVIEHRKTNACAWGSWMRADNVFTIPNFHLLYVFYKETREKRGGTSTIEKREFIEWTRGRWSIRWEPHKEHPASFPTDIPMRCMKLFGHAGDVVLDPFMGSGTTGKACLKLGRKFIGTEISPDYFGVAEQRIREEQMQLRLPLVSFSERVYTPL